MPAAGRPRRRPVTGVAAGFAAGAFLAAPFFLFVLPLGRPGPRLMAALTAAVFAAAFFGRPGRRFCGSAVASVAVAAAPSDAAFYFATIILPPGSIFGPRKYMDFRRRYFTTGVITRN